MTRAERVDAARGGGGNVRTMPDPRRQTPPSPKKLWSTPRLRAVGAESAELGLNHITSDLYTTMS